MARKSLQFTEGEFGFTHTFHIFEEDGTNADISGFTGIRLIIYDEVADIAKLNITTNLVISDPNVEWSVQDGQTDFNGTFTASIHLTGTGVNEKVYQFPAIVTKKLV